MYAFDVDLSGQRLTRKTASANRVSKRVHVRGACTVDDLEELVTPHTLVVLDCEGCEKDLLHLDRAPSLRMATLVVELHDFVDREISSEVLSRFRATHSIDVIAARERAIADYPVVLELDPADRAQALSEWRPTDPHPQEWAVLRPMRTEVPG